LYQYSPRNKQQRLDCT